MISLFKFLKVEESFIGRIKTVKRNSWSNWFQWTTWLSGTRSILASSVVLLEIYFHKKVWFGGLCTTRTVWQTRNRKILLRLCITHQVSFEQTWKTWRNNFQSISLERLIAQSWHTNFHVSVLNTYYPQTVAVYLSPRVMPIWPVY